jgi:S-adenosylmethionine hydrolase
MTKTVVQHPPRNSPPPIALLTDFGLADGYVGAMKGVILDILPWAQLVDITHEIAPQDVEQGAFVLHTVAPFFPIDTVFLVVVDPGVGTERRPIAVFTDRAVFVGPDNGVFTWIYRTQRVREVRELSNPYYMRPEISATFHGRDIFAPFAAHIASGVPATSIGPAVPEPVELALPEPEVLEDGALRGHVIHIDAFGNVITNITEGMLIEADDWRFEIAGRQVATFIPSYGHVEPGQMAALIGSMGYVEIAVSHGSAARELGAARGMDVIAYPQR